MTGKKTRGTIFRSLLAAAFAMAISLSPASAAGELQLITPELLQREKSRWIILDARPKTEWSVGHIPEARSFSWEDYTRTDELGIPFRPLPPAELAAALGSLGIDERSHVVVYGDADSSWGGEGWTIWILSWLGHQGPIRLLDGGIQGWRQGGFPLSVGDTEPAASLTYALSLQPQHDITTEDLMARQESLTLVDVRSPLEWLKERIPGAVRIPWSDFYEGPCRSPLSPEKMKRLMADKGIDPGKPVVFYCTGGVRSAYAWMVHQLAGFTGGINYEGGMEDWLRRPGGDGSR